MKTLKKFIFTDWTLFTITLFMGLGTIMIVYPTDVLPKFNKSLVILSVIVFTFISLIITVKRNIKPNRRVIIWLSILVKFVKLINIWSQNGILKRVRDGYFATNVGELVLPLILPNIQSPIGTKKILFHAKFKRNHPAHLSSILSYSTILYK